MNNLPQDKLNEREFELVNIVGARIASNQRDLSRHLDLSLGMTNMLLRRLVIKGYIRIRQLNKRKVEYMLTSKGFAEKMRKSIKYTVKTINSIGMIRSRLKEILVSFHEKGERKFVILGQSDLALLVEDVLKEVGLPEYQVFRVSELPATLVDGVLLICKENVQAQNGKSVNLIQELAKSNFFQEESRGV